jgi:hypothetical protein
MFSTLIQAHYAVAIGGSPRDHPLLYQLRVDPEFADIEHPISVAFQCVVRKIVEQPADCPVYQLPYAPCYRA